MKSWNKKMKSGYVWKQNGGNVRIMNMLKSNCADFLELRQQRY